MTAYSKNIAKIIDKHADLILVGDSLGSVLYNFNSTRSVTLDMMIKHSKSARLGISNSLMIVDMPFNTYNNPTQALNNCKKIIDSHHNAYLDKGGYVIAEGTPERIIKNKDSYTGYFLKKELLSK